MKKITSPILSLLLTAMLLINLLPQPTAANAADNNLLIGDADHDDEVSVMDATTIQRWLSNLRSLSVLEEFLGDVDGDNKLTIMDATAIQRKVAQLDTIFWKDRVMPKVPVPGGLGVSAYYPNNAIDNNVYVDAAVRLWGYAKNYHILPKIIPNYYEFYIDGKRVADKARNNGVDYVFNKTGEYTLTVKVSNVFGENEKQTTINVIDSPDKPYIADAVYDRNEHTLRASASGGTGGYRYKYYISYENSTEPTEGCTEGPVTPTYYYEPQPSGIYDLTTDYVDADYVTIPQERLNTNMSYCFYVSVIDKNGTESERTMVTRGDIGWWY